VAAKRGPKGAKKRQIGSDGVEGWSTWNCGWEGRRRDEPTAAAEPWNCARDEGCWRSRRGDDGLVRVVSGWRRLGDLGCVVGSGGFGHGPNGRLRGQPIR
jgi:hypothetical protein